MMIGATIAILLRGGGPPDVADLIMPVYINSVNRVFGRWSMSKLSEKLLERCKSKFNSSPAVQIKAIVMRIAAPRFGVLIGSIFLTHLRPAVAMNFGASGFAFGGYAPARSRMSVFHIIAAYRQKRSAIAFAKPLQLPVDVAGVKTYYQKAAETLAGYQNWLSSSAKHRWLEAVRGSNRNHSNSLPHIRRAKESQ